MPDDIAKVTELTAQVTDMEAQIAALTKQLEVATEGQPDLAKMADITAQLDEATKSLELASQALDQMAVQKQHLELLAKMSDAEKAHCEGMSEEEKASFMAKSPEDRSKEMEKIAKSDESVTIEGQVIRKSAVGPEMFTMLKAQADRIAATEKNLAIEKAARETAVLEKRAEDQFAHVPGTVQERAAMLGAIAKMDPALQKSFTTVLETAEKMVKAGFDTLGHKGGKTPVGEADKVVTKAVQDFETKVAEIRKRDSCTQAEAMTKARKEHQDLFKAYQEAQAN